VRVEKYGLLKSCSKEQSTSRPVRTNEDLLSRIYSCLLSAIVFSSNFAEGSGISYQGNDQTPRKALQDIDEQTHMILDEFEDSDDDDDEEQSARGSQHSLSSINLENFTLHLPDSNTTAGSDHDKGDFESVHSTEYRDYTSENPNIQASTPKQVKEEKDVDPRMSVVVRDAAYTTYFAILYYVS